MAFASFVAVVGGLVPADTLSSAINLDVILFLIGMFSIVAIAEDSGLLEAAAYFVVSRAGGGLALLFALSLLFGVLSAFTVNDAVALMGPPIVLAASRAAGMDLEGGIFLLAFALTIGSVMAPLGNPQNVLIAVESGMPAPLFTFMEALAAPTLINLALLPLLIAKWYGVGRGRAFAVPQEAVRNRRDALIAGIALVAVVASLAANDALEVLGLPHIVNIGVIPFIIAAASYVLVSEPRRVLEKVSWGTIVFFITMFIAMQGVWNSGVLTPLISALLPRREGPDLGILAITAESLIFSQVLSNVPFTELFIQYAKSLGYGPTPTWPWLTMAMATTIAGNLTLLGAASNIIILEVIESKYNKTIEFAKFIKRGAVITALNVAVYLPFLYLFARL